MAAHDIDDSVGILDLRISHLATRGDQQALDGRSVVPVINHSTYKSTHQPLEQSICRGPIDVIKAGVLLINQYKTIIIIRIITHGQDKSLRWRPRLPPRHWTRAARLHNPLGGPGPGVARTGTRRTERDRQLGGVDPGSL